VSHSEPSQLRDLRYASVSTLTRAGPRGGAAIRLGHAAANAIGKGGRGRGTGKRRLADPDNGEQASGGILDALLRSCKSAWDTLRGGGECDK
jgi:hypothetical protein